MVSHTYPPPMASKVEGLGNTASSVEDTLTGSNNGSVGQVRVPLVEDRLTGDRRNLPAPPSHRSAAPAANGHAAARPAARATTRLSPLAIDDRPESSFDRGGDTALLTSTIPAGFGVDDATATTTDLTLTEDRAHDPYQDPAVGRLSLSRRIMRGGLVVGLIGAIAALMVVMPDDDGSAIVETATDTGEESPLPLATAEMLDNTSGSVDVSLGASDSLESIAISGYALRSGSPADTPEGFGAAINEVVEDATAPATTTTTVWVEPALPPESEWVDGGNGVLVPDIQLRIRFCESTNNYAAANSGSSARGAYQFLTKSWKWYGHAEITGVEQAHLATPAQQDEAALRTLQAQGTGPWAESRACWNDKNIDSSYATAPPPSQPTTTVPTTDPDGETTVPDGEATTTVEGSPTTTVPETETTVEETTTTVEETTTTTAPDDGGEDTSTSSSQP